MKRNYPAILCTLLSLILTQSLVGQSYKDAFFPVRGLCIAAPTPDRLMDFIQFIDQELAPKGLNTLILRIDWNYQYQSHPELQDSEALSRSEVRQLVESCKNHKITLIPQINLLGHQSWASQLGKLLQVYPEFDETPDIHLPENYEWPNKDFLYCKSYCPLHPEIHPLIFDLIDEIMDAFESEYFHAGMDEVFYIAHENCPRCKGKDPAVLFAGEVNRIQNHLAKDHRKLMIWGDRLIDGETSGMGMWEASMNHTHKAIDLISREVIICDWHYERAEQSAVYFALKGFQVLTCPYNKPTVAMQQISDMMRYRATANPDIRSRYQGILQTVWSDAGSFIDNYRSEKVEKNKRSGSVDCLRAVLTEFSKQVPAGKLPEGSGIKIMTYNVLTGFDWNQDSTRGMELIDWLNSQKPDVLALEEMNGFTPERLADFALKWGHPYSALLKTSGYPVALTSRKPIVVKERLVDGLWHGMLHCETYGIDFMVVHLSPADWKFRKREADSIASRIKKVAETQDRIIVLGDFNAHSPFDAELLRQFPHQKERYLQGDLANKNYQNLNKGEYDFSVLSSFLALGLFDLAEPYVPVLERTTCPTPLNVPQWLTKEEIAVTKHRIDFILGSRSIAEDCVHATIFNAEANQYLSDHYPVLVELSK